MLRRLGIRAKVLAVLAVPMLVLFGAGVYISYSAIKDYQYAAASKVAIASGEQLIEYTDALMAERIAALTGAADADLKQAQAATDAALTTWQEAAANVDEGQFPTAVHNALANALQAGPANTKVARGLPGDPKREDEAYVAAINPQMQVGEAFANALKNREAAAFLSGINALGDLSGSLVSELIAGLALPQSVSPEQDGPAYAGLVTATELARTQARGALYALDSDTLYLPSSDPDNNLLNWRTLLSSGSPQSFALVDFPGYAKNIQTQLAAYDALQKEALHEGTDVAAKAASDARSRALLTIAIAALAAAISLVVAFTVSRAIVNPLRRLTRAAADVRDELPRLVEQMAVPGQGPEVALDPIPVRSRDEVGRLAEAFNSVNATTVQVAQEQAALRGSIAEMFVNVARRDQVLLNRQLSFIDSLERAEEDPSTLANLFRLDHLATRMRRNAESLLVLAGIDTGRRLRDAMPLSDVIRTASSEIEQYDRIELDLQVDPPMLGFNALSAAHMLAELLENATIFSEPETPVTVTTGISGAGVVVRILDHGLGMTDAEIEAANTKIVSTSASDALGAQRLGLFVVGRIAQRLGAEVTLVKSTRGTGTETVVRFPATLFASAETSQYGAPPAISAVGPVAPAEELPEVEAPVVEEVDLAALTDGQTTQGLPRRRRGDADDTDSGAIPLPAAAAAVADSGLPTRPRKTFDENNIVLPDAPAANLSPDLSSSAAEWTPPVVAAAPGGLPSRSRAATSAWQAPAEETSAQSAPATPAARAGLFSGFRGRTELASDAPAGEQAVNADADGSASQVRAPWMALGGAHAAAAEPVVVPGLAPDDEPWRPADAAEPSADAAEAAADQGDVWVPGFADADADADGAGESRESAATDEADEPWAPQASADEPTVPAWSGWDASAADVAVEPAGAVEHAAGEQPWMPTFAPEAEAQAEAGDAAATHEPVDVTPEPVDQPWAPTFAPAEAAEPVWAPSFEVGEPVSAETSPAAEPVAADEAWAPTFPAEPVVAEPVVAEPAAAEAAWEPTFEAEPVAASIEAAQDWAPTFGGEPEPEREPEVEPQAADEPLWAPYEPVAAADAAGEELPAADSPFAQPALAEPALAELETAEPVVAELAVAEPVVAEPVVDEPLVAEPAAAEHDAPAPYAQPAAEAAPVAAAAEPTSFTGYSGYAGWTGRAARAFGGAPLTGNEFERTLDEARAWHTGAIPVVHRGAEARAAEAASASVPVVPAPVQPEDHAAFAPVVAEPAYDGHVAPEQPEPGYDAPAASEPVEPAADEAGTAWPVASWETPSWQAPAWAQPAPEAARDELVDAEPVADLAPVAEPVTDAPFVVPALEDEPAQAPVTAWDAPAWPSAQTAQADVDSPTQLFSPIDVEAAGAPADQLAPDQLAPEPFAPAEPAAPAEPFAAAEPFAPAGPFAPAEPAAAVPAWAPSAPAAAPQPDVAFHELVAPAAEESGKKKRRGLFGRRKEEKAEAAPAYTPTPPAPEASLPVRTSAWTSEPVAEAATPAAWPAAGWQSPQAAPAPVAPAPAPAPVASPAPAPFAAAPAPAPQPAAPAPAAAGWTPPEWTGGPAGQPAISTVPHPSMPPSEAPRIGALDDEVAAMLALRSDIQEQALAELSQLSTYRPSAVRPSERLTKRVPTAVPAAAPEPEEQGAAAPRDAEQLRSRLSSFQSGSARGRRAAGDAPQEGQPS